MTQLRSRLLLTTLWLGIAAVASAAEFHREQLERLPQVMQQFVDDHELAGAVVAVGNQDGVVHLSAVGQLTAGGDQPMPKDAIFRIASMTKPIIATAIIMLQDEGKLSVEDPVEKHLPEFRGQMLVAAREGGRVTLTKPERPITLRDLLTHTSGLPGGYPEGISDLYARRHLTLAESVYVSSQRPLDFPPGSKWSYCNTGIDTLGRVVEVVSGQPLETFLQERLFGPLGMKDTTFFPTAAQKKRITPVYGVQDGKLVEAKNVLIGLPDDAKHPIPAGGLCSTAGDLGKLYQMLLGRGQLNGHRYVSETGWKEMTKLQTGDLTCGFVPGMGFGFGFAVVKEPGGVTAMLSPGTFGHGGAFGTQGWIDPEKNVFVVLLIQRTGLANGDASEMRRAFQTAVFDAVKK